MKIDRIDVATEEIVENCDEYLIISCEFNKDDEYVTRANVSTDGEILSEALVEEMLLSEELADFLIKTVRDYEIQKPN
tara:strand:- start:369 stop:602 length:234 start_codon:yes stop_codon:yes gene_type:complete